MSEHDESTDPAVEVTAVDVDGDGTIDVVVATDADGNAIAVVDVDGDGSVDAIISTAADGVAVDEDGDGMPDVLLVDLDGDGTIDAVATLDEDGNVVEAAVVDAE